MWPALSLAAATTRHRPLGWQRPELAGKLGVLVHLLLRMPVQY
jgi:hypothetical protein